MIGAECCKMYQNRIWFTVKPPSSSLSLTNGCLRPRGTIFGHTKLISCS